MPGRVSSPGFVGRLEELGELESALARAEEGHATTVVVAGEAGVGKTRPVRQFAGLALGRGARVLSGPCIELLHGAVPYTPLVEALRTLATDLAADQLDSVLGTARPELARLVPSLAEGGAPPSGLRSAAPAQSVRFEHVLCVLQRLRERSPVDRRSGQQFPHEAGRGTGYAHCAAGEWERRTLRITGWPRDRRPPHEPMIRGGGAAAVLCRVES